jgi:hypothetical protein
MKVDQASAARQQRIASALGEIGFALPGSLTVRAYRCGKTRCRCRGEPPQLHGPYAFWTRKVDNKTVTRMLTEEQAAELQPLFDNARRLRALVGELQDLTLELIEESGAARSARAADESRQAPAELPRTPPAGRQSV